MNDLSNQLSVKVYHGYGYSNNLVVYGHVFTRNASRENKFSGNIFHNISHLARLFFVKALPFAKVRLYWNKQIINAVSESDGLFKFEWKSAEDVAAGWHPVKVEAVGENGDVMAAGEGKVFAPHLTQYGFVSDIDDTVMISHSAQMWHRLKVLFSKNPRTRRHFSGVAEHYKRLSMAHTEPETPNPFFYVSSSEWNLYDYLKEFFRFNGFPEGVFLLSPLKRWNKMSRSGQTKHQGKLLRIMRIFEAFPQQHFILFGDNSQADPEIYAALAEKYSNRIFAVYIRNIKPKKEANTLKIFTGLESKGIHTCIFKNSKDAMKHSQQKGLI